MKGAHDQQAVEFARLQKFRDFILKKKKQLHLPATSG